MYPYEPPLEPTSMLSIDVMTGKRIEWHDEEAIKKLLDEAFGEDPPSETKDVSREPSRKDELQKEPTEHIENKEKILAYQFIAASELQELKTSLTEISSLQLNKQLEALCFPKDKSHFSYSEIRNEICAINMALNERQEIAPQYRSMCKPPRLSDKKYSSSDSTMSNDRQIIDIHWLWSSAEKHSHIEPPEYKGILSNTEFDYQLAEKFVTHVGVTDLKAKLLGLTELEELTLFSLQRKTTRDRMSTINKAYPDGVIKIRSAALSPRSKISAHKLEETYIVYKALKIARGSPSQAADIYRLMTNNEITQKQVSKIKAWLIQKKVNLE